MAQAIPEHLLRILDLARWAPSGDNTQPWRFEVLGDEHILVHGFDTRDHVVYDLDGHASQLAVGALLETMAIAASTENRVARFERRPDTPETHLLIDVRLQPAQGSDAHPLAACIARRVVQRRPMSTQPLSPTAKQLLRDSLGPNHDVVWYEGPAWRRRLARFMFDNAKIRLSIPEAFTVHATVIEWDARYSTDRIPDQAVGADPLTLKLMRWAMSSWRRVAFMNRYLLGDLAPRIQLDILPGLFCAAHFALLARQPPSGIDDYLAAGRAMQRFWLTACQQGLFIQPEMTPVIFTRYVRENRPFTRAAGSAAMATRLNERLGKLLPGHSLDNLVFMGRIGAGKPPRSRSLRKSVDLLLSG
jgi:hypothetical protein